MSDHGKISLTLKNALYNAYYSVDRSLKKLILNSLESRHYGFDVKKQSVLLFSPVDKMIGLYKVK